MLLLLVVRPPFPRVFPEVGDAATRLQFQKAQGTNEISSQLQPVKVILSWVSL